MYPEPPKSLLVLDDEPDARELVKLVLEPRGFTVRGAGEGEDALRLLKEYDISVALVDLLMPGMSGREFLERMAQLPESMRPVCIANSARRRQEVERELQGLEYFDILTKPYELHDLEDRIARAWVEKGRRLPR